MPGQFSLFRAAPRRDRESGQALLELALVVPILVLIALAIFQFAFVIESQMGLTNAVREAARRGGRDRADHRSRVGRPRMTAWVRQQLCGASIAPCTGGLLEDNVQGFEASRLAGKSARDVLQLLPRPRTTELPGPGGVSYQHPLFFGPARIRDGSRGRHARNNAWDLSASARDAPREHRSDRDRLRGSAGACA